MYTEAGVYFQDNQQRPWGDHDPSTFIETIKDGHAQMTFVANRTGTFFINAWNIRTWGIKEGGTGNNIYDLSLVHIPDDVAGTMKTSHTLQVKPSPEYGETTASLERVNDRDWFKVSLDKGAVYEFR